MDKKCDFYNWIESLLSILILNSANKIKNARNLTMEELFQDLSLGFSVDKKTELEVRFLIPCLLSKIQAVKFQYIENSIKMTILSEVSLISKSEHNFSFRATEDPRDKI